MATINGTAGDDRLVGGAARDRLFGLGGDDELIGGARGDLLDGGPGVDAASYTTATAAVTVDLSDARNNRGDAAGDTYVSIEEVIGSKFNDVMRAGVTAVSLFGGDGDDTLMGQFGVRLNDRLYGGDGNDFLMGGLGADRLVGGRGFDRAVHWESTSGLTVDLQTPANNTGEARGDSYSGIEALDGSSFADILRGDRRDNSLFGIGGPDRLEGGGGDDFLYGGDDADRLYGGSGDDALDGGLGGDLLNGGSGSDRASYFFASRGVTADLTTPSNNTGEAAGDTYASVEGLEGSARSDILRGDGAANRLAGNKGNDQLFGLRGDDLLLGARGDDRIDGGAGKDVIIGAAGRDTLIGGSGPDVFVFDVALTAANVDAITDFQTGSDTIEMSRFTFTGLKVGDLARSAFTIGEEATSNRHRIIYDDDSGAVLFDADGARDAAEAVQFATLSRNLALTADDFHIF